MRHYILKPFILEEFSQARVKKILLVDKKSWPFQPDLELFHADISTTVDDGTMLARKPSGGPCTRRSGLEPHRRHGKTPQ